MSVQHLSFICSFRNSNVILCVGVASNIGEINLSRTLKLITQSILLFGSFDFAMTVTDQHAKYKPQENIRESVHVCAHFSELNNAAAKQSQGNLKTNLLRIKAAGSSCESGQVSVGEGERRLIG